MKLMKRDGQEVPEIVKRCTNAVESLGLKSVGIYRLSGTSTQIQSLKSSFDRGSRSHIAKVLIKITKVCFCRLRFCKLVDGRKYR